MAGKYFKFKYSALDFSMFPEVKELLKEYKENKIDKDKAEYKLRDMYWARIYGSLEDFNVAFDILEKTLFNDNKLLTSDEVLSEIKKECEAINREDLYVKIVNTCPNGDSVSLILLDQ